MFSMIVASWIVSLFIVNANEFEVIPGPAVLQRNNGSPLRGQLLSLSNRKAVFRANRTIMQIPSYHVISITTGNDTYTYDRGKKTFISARRVAQLERIASEERRSGFVRVENSSGKAVLFRLTSIRNIEGESVYGQADWKLQPMEVLELTSNGGDIFKGVKVAPLGSKVITSKIGYSVVTADGARSFSAEGNERRPGVSITIGKNDVSIPLLVKVDKWRFEQNISYRTVRERTPVEIVQRRKFFSNAPTGDYYVMGGDEREYEREDRAGTATAWSDIENPTNTQLDVSITLRFRFTHLLIEHRDVAEVVRLPPNSKKRVYFTVNTRMIFGNTKVVGVNMIKIWNCVP